MTRGDTPLSRRSRRRARPRLDHDRGRGAGGGDGGGGAGDTRIGDLERLANLHDRGVLTDEEFRMQKTALLQHGA